MANLKQVDPILFELIEREKTRQETTIDLIASENYAPISVLEAAGSVLTNKYAEGYPGKRYYGGCEVVDEVEQVAIARCKELFGADHANVQPHAGSQANMAAYFSVLNFGDTILGMSLAEGGHLTHGHQVNFSGKVYNSVQYTVDKKTEQLDYDEIARLAQEHKPKLIIAGASAYSCTIDFEKFSEIARSVDALLLVDIAHIAGLVAADLHQSPIPYADLVTSTTHKTLRGPRGGLIMCKKEFAQQVDKAVMPGMQGGPFMQVIAAKAVAFHLAQNPDFKEYQKQVIVNARFMAKQFEELGYRIVAGGTDTHLFIIDLRSKDLNGKIAERVLQKIGISISRSCIPFDPEPAWVTSGIRIGTPAVTTRGMKEADMAEVVSLIDEALTKREDDQALGRIKDNVKVLCARYPVY